MKISKDEAIREDWDKVKSWNFKLKHLSPQKSVVYAEVTDDHSEVVTGQIERIYYIIEGEGEFVVENEVTKVSGGDVFIVPPMTTYNYHSLPSQTLKLVMFMDIWDN